MMCHVITYVKYIYFFIKFIVGVKTYMEVSSETSDMWDSLRENGPSLYNFKVIKMTHV